MPTYVPAVVRNGSIPEWYHPAVYSDGHLFVYPDGYGTLSKSEECRAWQHAMRVAEQAIEKVDLENSTEWTHDITQEPRSCFCDL